MEQERIKELERAATIIVKLEDKDAELAALIARSMQTGYEIGKSTEKAS